MQEAQYRLFPIEPDSMLVDCTRETYLKDLEDNSKNILCINGQWITERESVVNDDGEPVLDSEGNETFVYGKQRKLSDSEVAMLRAQNAAEGLVCNCEVCRREKMEEERKAMYAEKLEEKAKKDQAQKLQKAEKAAEKKVTNRFVRSYGAGRKL